MAIDASMSVVGDETDANTADNLSFTTVDAADLNIAPSLFAPSLSVSSTENEAFMMNVSWFFNDADGDDLALSATGLPPSLNINPNTGVISGTPLTADIQSAAYTVTVTAVDSFGGSANGTLALTVNPARLSVEQLTLQAASKRESIIDLLEDLLGILAEFTSELSMSPISLPAGDLDTEDPEISVQSIAPAPTSGNSVGSVGEGGEGGCFIATAADGSYVHPQVHALRELRDDYLVPDSADRRLVSLYFRYSPIISVVAESDSTGDGDGVPCESICR